MNSRRNFLSDQQKDIKHNQNEKYQKKSAKIKGYHRLKTKKKNGNPFSTYSKHNRSTSPERKETKSKGTYEYSEKHRKVVGKKYLIFWNKKDKRDRETSNLRTDTRDNIGSYEYNPKKKKIVKKKFLFFQRYKHEKEISTFNGGKGRQLFRFHIFNRNVKTKPHRHSIFRKKIEKNYKKKKKLSPELFDPGMGIRI